MAVRLSIGLDARACFPVSLRRPLVISSLRFISTRPINYWHLNAISTQQPRNIAQRMRSPMLMVKGLVAHCGVRRKPYGSPPPLSRELRSDGTVAGAMTLCPAIHCASWPPIGLKCKVPDLRDAALAEVMHKHAYRWLHPRPYDWFIRSNHALQAEPLAHTRYGRSVWPQSTMK